MTSLADQIEAEMAEIDDSAPDSGSKLRKKLEQVLAVNRELSKAVTDSRAKEIISEKGLTFVKVDDLTSVPLDELEAKAAELEEARKAEFETTLRSRFEAQGLSGSQLDEAVQAILDGQPAGDGGQSAPSPTTGLEAINRQRSVQGGSYTPPVNPENLSARQKLELGLK